MAGQNDILIFDENKENILTQESYVSDVDRGDGFKAGFARSIVNNKVLRQVTMMCSALGELMKNRNQVAQDETFSALVSSMEASLPNTAEGLLYNHTTSGLTAENVQDAIDELADGMGGGVQLGTCSTASYALTLTGTVTATNNSATVTGSGTSFITQCPVGSTIVINGTSCYVSAVASNTSLTISTVYNNPTFTGTVYRASDEKAVTLDGFELENGATVLVSFENVGYSYKSTLNVNSTGAKPIVNKRGADILFSNKANEKVLFIYDATLDKYVLISADFYSARLASPSSVYINVALASEVSYIAPDDGRFSINCTGGYFYAYVRNRTNGLQSGGYYYGGSGELAGNVKCQKGDKIQLSYNGTMSICRFIYDEGSKP